MSPSEWEWLALYSINTRRAYVRGYMELVQFAQTTMDHVAPEQAQAWAEDMRARGVKSNTIRLRLAAISSWCQSHGSADITADITRPEKTRTTANRLSEQEARALISAISASDIAGLQDRALILGYLLTGQDARSWKWGDFRMVATQVSVGSSSCPLPLWNMINAYLRAAGRLDDIEIDDPIFTAISDRWLRLPNIKAQIEEIKPRVRTALSIQEVARRVRKYARLAGIERDVTIRDLRRTALALDLSGILLDGGALEAVTHSRPLRRAALLLAEAA